MTTGTYLDRILAQTRADLAMRKRFTGLRQFKAAMDAHRPRGFAAALRSAARNSPAVIAELKKASPSKGLIRAEFDPAGLAVALERGGAAAFSVLTDVPFFQGSLRDLQIASAATSLPCLRKDFIVDSFQITEARACGADAVLLIAAALTDEELRVLREAAHKAELDVLCEVHSPEEIERVLPLGCEIYGVNCRDLRTFQVDSAAADRMAAMLPSDAVRVAESGIGSAADIARLQSVGFNAFLIGESLMRAADPGAALAALLAPVPQTSAA